MLSPKGSSGGTKDSSSNLLPSEYPTPPPSRGKQSQLQTQTQTQTQTEEANNHATSPTAASSSPSSTQPPQQPLLSQTPSPFSASEGDLSTNSVAIDPTSVIVLPGSVPSAVSPKAPIITTTATSPSQNNAAPQTSIPPIHRSLLASIALSPDEIEMTPLSSVSSTIHFPSSFIPRGPRTTDPIDAVGRNTSFLSDAAAAAAAAASMRATSDGLLPAVAHKPIFFAENHNHGPQPSFVESNSSANANANNGAVNQPGTVVKEAEVLRVSDGDDDVPDFASPGKDARLGNKNDAWKGNTGVSPMNTSGVLPRTMSTNGAGRGMIPSSISQANINGAQNSSWEDDLFEGSGASVQGALTTKGFENRSLNRFEQGVFGLFYTMVKDRPQHRIVSRILVPLKLLQMLAFAFHRDYPWNPDVTSWFQTFLAWTQFNFSQHTSYSTHIVYFTLVSITLFASCANFIYVMYMFQSSVITSVWPIRMLRLVAGTLFTFLFIPLVRLLLVSVNCVYSGTLGPHLSAYPDIDCFGWPNGLLYALSLLGLVCLIPFAMMTSLVYFEGDIKSRDITARHHGRLDFLLLLIKLVLVFSEVLLTKYMTIRIICLVACSLVFLVASVAFQPYYSSRLNHITASSFSVFSFAAICTAACYGLNDTESIIIPVVFFALCVPVAIVGYKISKLRYELLIERVVKYYPESSLVGAFSDILGENQQSPFYFESDVEIAVRHLITCNPARTGYAHRLYLIGIKLFPQSQYILQSYVIFISTVKKNYPLTLKPIRALRRLELMVDTRFLIYVTEVDWTKSNHSQELGGGGLMDVMHYVDFQSNYNRAKTYYSKTRKLIQTFWEKVLDSTDEQFVVELPQLASDIVRNEKKCEDSYQKLLVSYPESRVLLRSYGQFVEVVKNDKESAKEYYAQADALEDPKGHERGKDNETTSHQSYAVGPKQRSQSNWIKRRDRAKLEVVHLLQIGTYIIGLFITLTTITFFILGRFSHTSISDFLDSSTDLSQTSKYSQTAFTYLRSLGLASQNHNGVEFQSNSSHAILDMSKYQYLHQKMYDASNSLKLVDSWIQNDYDLTESLPNKPLEIKYVRTTFFDGVNSYVQRTGYDSLRSNTSFKDDTVSDDYWFVLTNGPASIRSMYKDMQATYVDSFKAEVSNWINIFIIALGLSVGSNILFHIFFLRTLEKLQLFREKTLNIFLVIPKPVISDLLQSLKNARDDDEDGDEDGAHRELETISESQENAQASDNAPPEPMNDASRQSSFQQRRKSSVQMGSHESSTYDDGMEGSSNQSVMVNHDVEKDILKGTNDMGVKSKRYKPKTAAEEQNELSNVMSIDEKSVPKKKKKDITIHTRHTVGILIVQMTLLALLLAPLFFVQKQNHSVSIVIAAGDRWALVNRIKFFSREYMLGSSTFWTRSEIKKIIGSDVLRLKQIHDELKYGGKDFPSPYEYQPQHDLLYNPTTCLMRDLLKCKSDRIPGVITFGLDSLMERFISKGFRISQYEVNSTELSLGNEDFQYIWNAGEYDLNDALFTSLLLYQEEGNLRLDKMVEIINGLFGSSICIMVIIYMALLRPIIVYLKEESDNITRILSIIPHEWETRPLIEWSEKLSVGIDKMDDQHKVLLNLINAYYRAVLDLKGADVIGKVLEALVQYTVKHFSEEEGLMAEHLYPGCESHKELHKRLISQVNDFIIRLKHGDPSIDFRLMTFLRAWLTSHILGHDKKYGRFLLANGYENDA